ncbi:hypothetical protein GCM10027160_19810 [Streptomyces calidiresistens]|uniref:DNA-binding protein n=1 Tax=Streptomyces calidiresistens TaxID=1485586 RepID=A0A7W3T4E6_9ACTN|nr:hypothetical protein [Streptomyces calidiresistens]MBB0230717.1 hypothetical protein [Streptomyces calidiresistens]
MDRTELVERTLGKAADNGAELSAEQTGQIIDALFGTLERPGAIAEVIRSGEAVTVLGFGTFDTDGHRAVFRPGTALVEYLGHGPAPRR